MMVVEMTGEVTFCKEVDIVGNYVFADMVMIPLKDIYYIMGMEEPT